MKVIQKEDYADRATPELEKVADPVAQGEEKPYSEKNTRFVNISPDITSGFMFYPYNTLSIQPFTLGCLRKVFRAVSQQRMSHMVEVISFCIDPDKSASDLTVQDFWSLMFWERINSYKKSPYRIKFKCVDETHMKMVADGDADAESLDNEMLVKNTGELTLKRFDHEAVLEHINRVKEEYNISLYPARISDVVELEDLREGLTEQDDIMDLNWIGKLASNISKAHGATLSDRIDFLSTNPDISPDVLGEIEKFIELVDHGISEKTTVKCSGCGATREEELSFDVLSFFPDYK